MSGSKAQTGGEATAGVLDFGRQNGTLRHALF
jgi:hypothetical protein